MERMSNFWQEYTCLHTTFFDKFKNIACQEHKPSVNSTLTLGFVYDRKIECAQRMKCCLPTFFSVFLKMVSKAFFLGVIKTLGLHGKGSTTTTVDFWKVYYHKDAG